MAAHRSSCPFVRFSPVATPTPPTTRIRHSDSTPRWTADGSRWRPYEGVPDVVAIGNGQYRTEPQWYRGFLYSEEEARGLDAVEDLASPGTFTWDLSQGDAVLVLRCTETRCPMASIPAQCSRACQVASMPARAGFGSPLERAADAYLVRRGEGKTIVAGYPWFTDWGRDTFIALRGLCLATGRLADAAIHPARVGGESLRGHAAQPLRRTRATRPSTTRSTPRSGTSIAVHDYLAAMAARRLDVPARRSQRAEDAVLAILAGHVAGTRYGIRVDERRPARGRRARRAAHLDGRQGRRLGRHAAHRQAGGDPGALAQRARIAERFTPEYRSLYERGAAAFAARFWNVESADASTTWSTPTTCRDGSTPRSGPIRSSPSADCRSSCSMASGPARVVDDRRALLWTPLGLRTLAPGARLRAASTPAMCRSRDGAYHQGTVWPWLLGPFVEAWVRVRGDTDEARREARGASSSRCWPISTRRGSATSPRSPTPSRRTRRAAVRSRRGPSARRCGSTSTCSRRRRRRSGDPELKPPAPADDGARGSPLARVPSSRRPCSASSCLGVRLRGASGLPVSPVRLAIPDADLRRC